ncbi:cartilage intermediate layer protein 1-like isoform X2 [Argopecten irradians]|uniref:cartilage intermediate layer protein 1-like isoform X2 n=1 Tax=Argopecten irradians TaxID=31199 RepID=UPI0037171DE8
MNTSTYGSTTTSGTPVATTLHSTPGTTATTTQAPSTNGTWNNWGAWTSCGATCGTGYHTRYRTCLRTTPNDPICKGEYVQTSACSVATCPVYGVWTTWSGWAVCDVTCGSGTQQRTRVCQKASLSDLDCVGSSSQSQTCNTWNCPDCSQTCTTGSLNADCTACECTSNNVQGIVLNHANVPLSEASVAHARVPYKTLATTNETGGFTLDTTCDAVEIIITRTGYADVTAVVTGTTVSVQMSLIKYPAIIMNPKSRVRVQGENVTFCCEAFGTPAISSYEWMKDGVLLDDSKYPDGFNLTLNDVTSSDSGQYKCRANSPVGAIYSSSALLTVKQTQSEFCMDAYEEKKIHLPSDCVQDDGTTLYEVGGCAEKTCRGNSNEDGLCGASKKYCCIPSSDEERTVQCDGYTLQVLVVTGCSCGQCSSGDITIQGQVNGLNTGIPLRIGTVYVNGSSVARTTFSGLFSFTVPAGTIRVAITLEDIIFNTLLTTTKLITLGESTKGTVYQRITLLEAAPPITISSDVENTVSMGNDSGMPAVTELVIPPNAFVDASGNPYNGIVKASVNMFDPRNLSSISTAPGSFEFVDAEGETQNLQTFGVIVVDFKDESGNKLNVAGNVTIKMDAALVESADPADPSDVKLWGLDDVTGMWEEIGSMVVETTTRKKRQTLTNYLVGTTPISAFRAINLDYKYGFNLCFFKVSVVDANDIQIDNFNLQMIHMRYPGALYPSTSSEYVTAVQTVSANSFDLQSIWCRSDSWGYIRAYKGSDEYRPGDPDSSGLSATALSRLDYETINDPLGIKSKFLTSTDGPFYDDWGSAYYAPSTENHFRFHEGFAPFPDCTIPDGKPMDPAVAMRRSMMTKNDLGPTLWYPYTHEQYQNNYRVCMIKIVVNGSTDGLSFSVKSIAGVNSGIEDTILGVRQVAVEDGGACVEYKCSGVFPSFQNMINDITQPPTIINDETKIMITPSGRYCTVSWEGEIKSHSSNSGTSNIGGSSHEWLIPDTEEHGVYIYEQTLNYNSIDWTEFRKTTRNMCKEGVKSPGSANPTMNREGPAVIYTCI